MELVERGGEKVTPPPVEPWPVEEEEWVPPVIEWVEPEVVEPPPAPKVAVNQTPYNSVRGEIVVEEIDLDATIASGVTSNTMMVKGDEVFVSFDDPSSVNVGDRYTIFTWAMRSTTRSQKSIWAGSPECRKPHHYRYHGGKTSKEKNAVIAKIGDISQEILPGMHLKEYEALVDTIELVEHCYGDRRVRCTEPGYKKRYV